MNANPTALDAYLTRTAAIHAKLERLQQLADDHLGHDPDADRWVDGETPGPTESPANTGAAPIRRLAGDAGG